MKVVHDGWSMQLYVLLGKQIMTEKDISRCPYLGLCGMGVVHSSTSHLADGVLWAGCWCVEALWAAPHGAEHAALHCAW